MVTKKVKVGNIEIGGGNPLAIIAGYVKVTERALRGLV